MLLSLTKPSLLGVLLLLSMSNLLHWETVTSAPVHDKASDRGEVSLKDLFDYAIALSQTTSALTMEMRKLFVLDFLKNKAYMTETLNSCHTFSLNTPETVEEARDISFENFLKMIRSLVHAWNKPLHHLVAELRDMRGAPAAILTGAKGIKILNSELLESIIMILSKVHPGLEENETYPDWKDLDSLRAADEESHFFALYKLFYCLRVDTYTVDIYLKYLRCVLVNGDSCYAEEF